jgi:hypothetical protein
VLLFYSFQATSSSFRLITRSEGEIFKSGTEYSICIGDYTLLSTNVHGGIIMGHRGCPPSENVRPAAVVNTEHPFFVTIGFLMIILGFFIQLFAVSEPTTITQLRKRVRQLEDQQRRQRH